MKLVITAAALSIIACTTTAVAHHSFAAVFDRDRPFEITGTVTNVEWTNPHVWIYLDVENAASEPESWAFEMGSPNGLFRRGWNHDSLVAGQTVTLSGVLARDGSNTGAVRTVTLPGGEQLFGAQDESR